MIKEKLRERLGSLAAAVGTLGSMWLCGMVLVLAVTAKPGELYQSKQKQRKQGGVVPVLSLSDANRPLLSYDGQRIVVIPEVGVVEVYEVATRRKLQTLRVSNAGDYAITPDGKQVGIWGDVITWSDEQYYKSKGVFWVFDVDSGKELRHHDSAITRDGIDVAFLFALNRSKNVSADFKLVANLAPGKNSVPSVTLGNLETQQLVREFSFGEYSKLGVAGTVVMTPDARVIAATRRDLYGTNVKQTVAWDVSSGRELLRLPFEAISVSLSSDGRRLALNASQSDDYIIEIWSLENGKRISEIGLEFGSSRHIIGGGVLSPDGKLLATSRKNYILLWDTASGKLIAAQPVSNLTDDIVKSVVFSGDGRFIASGTFSEQVTVWRVADLLTEAKVLNVASLMELLR